ncbi:myo-inositol-1(or 4)-monophosphatase [Bosea sp. AK1]|nr:myo-inositol-1(or 4)-monophosphatase [Bosea sp. AK1]
MPDISEDGALISEVADVLKHAGRRMLAAFSKQKPVGSRAVINTIAANDEISLEALRAGLSKARPTASWVKDELIGGDLPPGEWWVVDPVEEAINLVHELTDWCVTATLMRENIPVLTVVHLPPTNKIYTAVRGGGSFLNGEKLDVSIKFDLSAAMVGTGQARPREGAITHKQIGRSVTEMLERALVVAVSAPARWQLFQLAAGRTEVFGQFRHVRSGLVAGALLVQKAGGIISDIHGEPWGLESSNFLAAAPGVHAHAVEVPSAVA